VYRDVNTVRKPDIVVMDAIRILTTNGRKDLERPRTLER